MLINQSVGISLSSIVNLENAHLIKEINTNGIVPLSVARNLALEYLYQLKDFNFSSCFTMFIDDDAWYPNDTLDFLSKTEVNAYAIQTIDPEINKSFINSKFNGKEIKGYHLISDICSICLIVPFDILKENNFYFHEKIGLGNKISQGEESLFIYNLHKKGIRIFGINLLIYHPYKKTFNDKNFYSLAYFFSYGYFYISKKLFCVPLLHLLIKYTVALLFTIKDMRYLKIFRKILEGIKDGYRNTENI